MAATAFQPLPELTLSAQNGQKIEFSIQRYVIRDVQLRPRIEKHEDTQYHSRTVRYRGENVGSVGFTSTDTKFSMHNDTRLLIADAISGQENILDLRGVEDGYFRDDVLVLAMWRIANEQQFTPGYLRNHTRGSSFRWLFDRKRLSAISSRGVLPNIPVWIDLAILLFCIWPACARTLQSAAQFFSSNSNIPWMSWVAGLAVAWYGSSKVMAWVDRWWHDPIDQGIQAVYRTTENVANNPPRPTEDAEKLRDVTPRERFTGDETLHEFQRKMKRRLGLDP